MTGSVSARVVLVVFCTVGYFQSFSVRSLNAVLSKHMAVEIGVTPSYLVLCASMYLLIFVASQLPLGVLLDRYGPRPVVTSLLCGAAAGALVLSRAGYFASPWVGYALLGLGASAGLMGAIKAFTLWFPLSRLATLNGLYLAAGGIGGLSATGPAQAIIGLFGWRTFAVDLCAMSLLAASLVFFAMPEKEPGKGHTLPAQIVRLGEIFGSVPCWGIALPLLVCHAGYLALQDVWLASWVYDVAGASRSSVGTYLSLIGLAYTFSALLFGAASDHLALAGITRMTALKLGLVLSLAICGLLAAAVRTELGIILALYGFIAMSAAIAGHYLAILADQFSHRARHYAAPSP